MKRDLPRIGSWFTGKFNDTSAFLRNCFCGAPVTKIRNIQIHNYSCSDRVFRIWPSAGTLKVWWWMCLTELLTLVIALKTDGTEKEVGDHTPTRTHAYARVMLRQDGWHKLGWWHFEHEPEVIRTTAATESAQTEKPIATMSWSRFKCILDCQLIKWFIRLEGLSNKDKDHLYSADWQRATVCEFQSEGKQRGKTAKEG